MWKVYVRVKLQRGDLYCFMLCRFNVGKIFFDE